MSLGTQRKSSFVSSWKKKHVALARKTVPDTIYAGRDESRHRGPPCSTTLAKPLGTAWELPSFGPLFPLPRSRSRKTYCHKESIVMSTYTSEKKEREKERDNRPRPPMLLLPVSRRFRKECESKKNCFFSSCSSSCHKLPYRLAA
jgi:hypothetical protein